MFVPLTTVSRLNPPMRNWADSKLSVNSGNSHRDNPEPRQCKTHEGVETRHGSTLIICKICGKAKSPKDFYKKDKKTGRLDSICKACRISQLREKTLGVTDEIYWKLYKKQRGRCGICGKRLHSKRYKAFCVDHDHTTGEIRGLLCSKCNLAIEGLCDDPAVIRKAAEWVEGIVRHSEQSELTQ